ncbi:MAG: sugar ABC transporter substrate-binding protein [Chloroflexi bacterium]|nr:sugar ABC transporter substrate-binding protein [Chloroflexota bacterium]
MSDRKKQVSRRDFLKIAASGGAVAFGSLSNLPVNMIASAQDMVTLNVWHTNETELNAVIEAFEAANPNISIDFQYYPWGAFFDNLQTAYAGGAAPDVHRQDDDEIPFFVQRGALAPLTEALSELNPDDFFWDALASTAINGDVWVAVPAMRVDNLIINKTMFEEAGVALPPLDYPSADWSWEAFVEASVALTDADNLVYGMAGVHQAGHVISHGRALGGDVISEDCMEFLMNGAPMVRAYNNAAALVLEQVGAVDPETEDALGGRNEMFVNGQAAMVYAQSRFPGGIDEVDFEWEIRGIPTYADAESPSNFLAIECYGVPASGAHIEEASKFAVFLMGQEAQQILAETKSIIPFNKAAAYDIWLPMGPVGREIQVEALNYARSLPFAVGFGEVQDAVWPLIQQIFLGQRSAQEVFDEAKPIADEILAAAGGCTGDDM